MALSWTLHTTGTGYKVIKATLPDTATANTAIVVKNDGSILQPVANSSLTAINQQYNDSTTIYVSIADTVTDFAAYFVTNPYTLHYKYSQIKYHVNDYNEDKTKPIMQGTVNIPQGVTQIEQRSGVVWREIQSSLYSTATKYYINYGTVLKYTMKSPILVEKNNTKDTVWIWYKPYADMYNSSYNYLHNTTKTNFDPSVVYSITYEQLDKYLYTVDTFSISNPTVSYAYAYQDVSNSEHNVGYFSFNTPLFTHDSANNAITISKGSVNGFADYYEYLPDQFTTPSNATILYTSERLIVTTDPAYIQVFGKPTGYTEGSLKSDPIQTETSDSTYRQTTTKYLPIIDYKDGKRTTAAGTYTNTLEVPIAQDLLTAVSHITIYPALVRTDSGEIKLRVSTNYSNDTTVVGGTTVVDYPIFGKILEK